MRASSQVVQTNTSGNLGTTFDQRTIESLPIVGGRGRNPLDLVLTQPGVVSGANTGGGVHVNGARDRSWNFTLDGIDTNESSAGGSNFSPLRTNPDALAEFKVLTGNQTAEFGRNSGGQVAMITRSGTNRFPARAFYFDRRPEYNANEWENNIDDLAEAQLHAEDAWLQRRRPDSPQPDVLLRQQPVAQRRADAGDHAHGLHRQARQGLWRYVIGARNRPAGVTGASVDANGNSSAASTSAPTTSRRTIRSGLGLDPDHSADRRADAAAEQLRRLATASTRPDTRSSRPKKKSRWTS